MREAVGDIWSMLDEGDAIVITINGIVTPDGRLVMGKGIALEARTRTHGVDKIAGSTIRRLGLHAFAFSPAHLDPRWDYLFMPVKIHWRERADLRLMVASAREMVRIADSEQEQARQFARGDSVLPWSRIYLPHVGCGAGGLKWDHVRAVLGGILDNRFIAVAQS